MPKPGSCWSARASEFGEPACRTAARQHGDEIDRVGDQRARNRDHGFLNELLHATQRADRRTGVDRADAAWMAGKTGRGITVGIIEGGWAITHPDLAANYSSAASQTEARITNKPLFQRYSPLSR